MAAVILMTACGSKTPTEPGGPGGAGGNGGTQGPQASSVTVSSPLDSILARGGDAQLSALVVDTDGGTVAGATLEWSSSDTDVLTVTSAGIVTARDAGTATVTAAVTGSSVSGTLRFRVVEADLATVVAITADPLGNALTDALTGAESPSAQEAWTDCGAAAATGHIVDLLECAAFVRERAASAADPTDRRVLAALALLADHVEHSLGL